MLYKAVWITKNNRDEPCICLERVNRQTQPHTIERQNIAMETVERAYALAIAIKEIDR